MQISPPHPVKPDTRERFARPVKQILHTTLFERATRTTVSNFIIVLQFQRKVSLLLSSTLVGRVRDGQNLKFLDEKIRFCASSISEHSIWPRCNDKEPKLTRNLVDCFRKIRNQGGCWYGYCGRIATLVLVSVFATQLGPKQHPRRNGSFPKIPVRSLLAP